jgi:hypothetical protein
VVDLLVALQSSYSKVGLNLGKAGETFDLNQLKIK